jgi:hypothetical protein
VCAQQQTEHHYRFDALLNRITQNPGGLFLILASSSPGALDRRVNLVVLRDGAVGKKENPAAASVALFCPAHSLQ